MFLLMQGYGGFVNSRGFRALGPEAHAAGDGATTYPPEPTKPHLWTARGWRRVSKGCLLR